MATNMNNFEYEKSTISRYQKIITKLRSLIHEEVKEDIDKDLVFITHKEIVANILVGEESIFKLNTGTSYISAVIWHIRTKLFKREELLPQCSEAIEYYRDLQDKNKEIFQKQEYDRNFSLTDREEKTFIRWEDFMMLQKSMDEDSDTRSNYASFLDFVIVSLYTLHPPVRLDYCNMDVYLNDEDIPESQTNNYVCMFPDSGQGYFAFLKYKTYKTHGVQTIQIDDKLHAILTEWLSVNNGPHLLCTYSKNKDVYKSLSENSLSKRLARIFELHFGRLASVNILRHSFISYQSRNDQPIMEKRENARKMLHTSLEADEYRRYVY